MWHFKVLAIHIFVFIMHIMSFCFWMSILFHSFVIKDKVFWKLTEGSPSVVDYHPEMQSSSKNKEFPQSIIQKSSTL